MEHQDVVGSRKENGGGFGRNVPVLLLAVSMSTHPFDVDYAYVLGREEEGQALHIPTRLRCKTGTRCVARGAPYQLTYQFSGHHNLAASQVSDHFGDTCS
jgi:hypothetical protein